MSNERELLEKAQQGNPDAALELGVMHYNEGDMTNAISWWKKAAGVHPDAARNAARNLVFTVKNRDDFLKYLFLVAEIHQDPWGMAMLGTLYCGVEVKFWEQNGFQNLPPLNRERGKALIEEGVRRTENGEGVVPFYHYDYSAFSEAQYFRNGKSAMKESSMQELQDAKRYQEKAVALCREAAEPGSVEADLLPVYEVMLANIEKVIGAFLLLGAK